MQPLTGFLSLPREIRDLIYLYAIPPRDVNLGQTNDYSRPPPPVRFAPRALKPEWRHEIPDLLGLFAPPQTRECGSLIIPRLGHRPVLVKGYNILLVCRQVSREAAEILYSHPGTILRFWTVHSFVGFVICVGDYNASFIRRVYIRSEIRGDGSQSHGDLSYLFSLAAGKLHRLHSLELMMTISNNLVGEAYKGSSTDHLAFTLSQIIRPIYEIKTLRHKFIELRVKPNWGTSIIQSTSKTILEELERMLLLDKDTSASGQQGEEKSSEVDISPSSNTGDGRRRHDRLAPDIGFTGRWNCCSKCG